MIVYVHAQRIERTVVIVHMRWIEWHLLTRDNIKRSCAQKHPVFGHFSTFETYTQYLSIYNTFH